MTRSLSFPFSSLVMLFCLKNSEIRRKSFVVVFVAVIVVVVAVAVAVADEDDGGARPTGA